MAKALYKVQGLPTEAIGAPAYIATVKLDREYSTNLQQAAGIIKVGENENDLPALQTVDSLLRQGILVRLKIRYRENVETNAKTKTQSLHVAGGRMPGATGSVVNKQILDPKASNETTVKGTIESAAIPRRRTYV